LCPSVVSVNKITRAESLIIVTWVSDQPLRNVVFGVTLRLLVTHFIVVSCHDAINKLGRSPVTSVIYSAWFVAAKFTASAAGTLNSICSEARYWLRIAISAYPTCILLGGEVPIGILLCRLA